MASRNRERGSYVYGENSSEALSTDHEAARQRHATLYDAVAGRVSQKFSKDGATSGSRKTTLGQHHLGDPVLPPEEVLFSRKRAPQRYAEKDIYFANESLLDGGRDILPDSDMVKGIHCYASHFYEALGRWCAREPRGSIGRVNDRSMDETALLAIGILLEESARQSLGRDGDLVLTEGLEDGGRGIQKESSSRRTQTPVGFEGELTFWKRPYAKRRKIKDETD
ncbi:hypothetical protein KVR01_001488 [Diaporthe batatas]|uniref:uncharacterized protein n=1 Tax=Diaporthe batatas TaxID=748121 RepID=UPI001D04AAD2|nr:uncharacterized protein KVR01_001488 [Diaporthe batatas]KAG8168739.1 hypothetical protein KVR01_001488 [Diaporthe batatas]